MAGGIKEALQRAKARREARTTEVSKTIDVKRGGKTRQVEFTGTQKVSKSGKRMVERLSSRFGTVTTRKKVTPRGEALRVKKRFAKT